MVGRYRESNPDDLDDNDLVLEFAVPPHAPYVVLQGALLRGAFWLRNSLVSLRSLDAAAVPMSLSVQRRGDVVQINLGDHGHLFVGSVAVWFEVGRA